MASLDKSDNPFDLFGFKKMHADFMTNIINLHKFMINGSHSLHGLAAAGMGFIKLNPTVQDSMYQTALPLTHARYLANKDDYTDITEVLTEKLPIKFNLDYVFTSDDFKHRSGWRYVMANVMKACEFGKKPIRVVDFIERIFCWDRRADTTPGTEIQVIVNGTTYLINSDDWRFYVRDGTDVTVAHPVVNTIIEKTSIGWSVSDTITTGAEFEQLPYVSKCTIREPWIGIWHNPHKMPDWFDNHTAPEILMGYPEFTRSMEMCRGIFVLSEYLAKWVRDHFPKIPVSVIYHPTQVPKHCFTLQAYHSNPEPCVVQIGYWLRHIGAIGHLQAPKHKKIWLCGGPHAMFMLEKEKDCYAAAGKKYPDMSDVHTLRLPDGMYDEVLASNIAFVWLYDSSANNAVIECIVRATPLLINRHPAAVEYLGEEYPLYCDDFEDASRKLQDDVLIARAHVYLRDTLTVRDRTSINRFIRDIRESDVVKRLL